MPSTGILNGTLGVVRVGGVTIAHLTSNNFNIDMATRDASTKGSGGWKDVLEGQRSWGGSASGYFAEDAAYGFEDLFGLINTRATVTLRFTTGVVGDKYYEGTAYITSITRTDGLEESSTFEATFEGTGAITKGTQA
jgi:predicted secreted protein